MKAEQKIEEISSKRKGHELDLRKGQMEEKAKASQLSEQDLSQQVLEALFLN